MPRARPLLFALAALAACVSPERRPPPPPSAPPPPTFYSADGDERAPGSTPATKELVVREVPFSTEPRHDHPIRNREAAIGMNLSDVAYFEREWVFVNVFAAASPWVSTRFDVWNDGVEIPLDAHGWPTKLKPGQRATALVPSYAGGRQVLRHLGAGQVDVEGTGIRVLSRAPGRVEFESLRDTHFMVHISQTVPGDHVRRIRIEPTSMEGAAETNVFHPLFLERLAPFSIVRFMNWGRINGSSLREWKDRPRVNDATQAGEHGVAFEYMILLANTLHADPWVCVPHLADDAFVEEMAKLFRAHLDPSLRLHVELSNEIWNDHPDFQQSQWALAEGRRLKMHKDPYAARLRFQGRRSAEVFEIFERVFEGTDRLVRIIGSQTGVEYGHAQLFSDPKTRAHTDAIAIAPYFGHGLGSPELHDELVTRDAAWALDRLADRALPETIAGIRKTAAFAKEAGLQLLAYEGGQHLVAHPAIHNDPVVARILDEANRHPKMGELYAQLLAAWRDAGGQAFLHYLYVHPFSKWGRWGALEAQDQVLARAPKYRALLEFMKENPKWW